MIKLVQIQFLLGITESETIPSGCPRMAATRVNKQQRVSISFLGEIAAGKIRSPPASFRH
jgi:hypothetical protein